MRIENRACVLCIGLVAATVAASAQQRAGVMGDLIGDMTRLESKVVALSKAIPESAYAWRPGEGVRSVAEALVHVAADNYFAAAKMGTSAPAETGISGKAYKEAEAYEQRKMTRGEIIAAVEQSFTLLKKSMADTPDDKLEAMTDFFGPNRKTSVRTAWIGTTTHLHEHLGQLIAYARMNKVVPPWSQ